MPSSRVCILALLALLLLAAARPGEARGQSRAETEERLRQLKQQIEDDQQRLSERAEAKEASAATLDDLNREIALRRELTTTYQRRLRQLSAEEDSLRRSLRTLEGQIATLQEEYRARATHAYKYGRLHDVALILASRSINQMLVRVRYLHRFTEQRRERLQSIQAATRTPEEQRGALEERRRQTVSLEAEAQQELGNLTALQQSRRQVVSELRAQEADLQREIGQQRQAAQELEAELRRLVARETARQRRASSASPEALAEFERLTGSFQQNQGGLPWPVPGAVSEPFGTITNPVYGTQTPNPGVFIETSPQAEVRAIFEGEIVNIDAMPDLGTIILVRHGTYLTLYGNFSMLYAGEGDYVQAGQVIGRAGTENEPRGAGLFFALFKDGQAVDPETWLQRR